MLTSSSKVVFLHLFPYSISDEKLGGGQQMSKSVSVLVSIKGTQRWAGRELFLETCS